jgi:RNA polymerase sigma factor (sigma-70 family)
MDSAAVQSTGVGVDSFPSFVAAAGPLLKRALVAALGGEVGREATAEALAYAWEHWERIREMANPAGYLYRVGRSRGVQMYRRHRGELRFPDPPSVAEDPPLFEPGLPAALGSLSRQQRVVVMLLHGYGWTQREVSEVLQISLGSVQRHAERGLERLRRRLKVEANV